ncbi:probable polyamine oxidase 2 [Selaginella moellendorffii]|nr:probable polyamine oxidase 2 [Selaginella moellendorffii]|eukprot:XP_002991392.2 probable polyamine oxidase 2 [Selaginella moellendorffii]
MEENSPKYSTPGPVSSPAPSVVIIGAGIAGIAAARALQDRGIEVTLLESSARIGGRIHTDKSSLTTPGGTAVPVDMGASWIHGATPGHNPIATAALDVLQLATHQTAGEGSLLYDHDVQRGFALYTRDGVRIPRDTVRQFESWFRAAVEAERRDARYESDASLEDTINRMVAEHKLQGSVDEEILGFYVCRIEGWFAADSSRISPKSWIEEEFHEGGHLLVSKGYSQLVESLARGIDIRLGHRAVRVTQQMPGLGICSKPHVQVSCKNGIEIRADAAIVAVPLGILQSNVIDFQPELPEWKRDAISSLEVGHQNKIALLFESLFWDEDAEFLGCATGAPRGCSYFLSLYPTLRRAVLVYMPVGELSRRIERMGDEEATAFAMEKVRAMLPGAPDPVSSLISRWSLDENFLCCYSNDPSPNGSDLFERMAMPASELLYFAGEASSPDFSGTVHGAYESGVAAAEQIVESLSRRRRSQRPEEQQPPPSLPLASLKSGGLSRPVVSSCNFAAHLLSLDAANATLTQVMH